MYIIRERGKSFVCSYLFTFIFIFEIQSINNDGDNIFHKTKFAAFTTKKIKYIILCFCRDFFPTKISRQKVVLYFIMCVKRK